MSAWVCTDDGDEGPASFADGDIYIVSRLQGVELFLLSKSASLERGRGGDTESIIDGPAAGWVTLSIDVSS